MSNKRLMGVIANWFEGGGMVWGRAIWHADPRLHNRDIHTSTVQQIEDAPHGLKVVETRNSLYVLLPKAEAPNG